MNPEDALPLRPVILSVLLALKDGPRHGYEVLESVESEQRLPSFLGPGSLYRTLKEMRERGLIEYRDPPADEDDRRRHYHGLTELGARVLEAEAFRLQEAFERSGLVPPEEPA
ncbi:MAG: PadR family transcriptional regulator [Gemmatimonadetes bacterium]|nr:PadR family transcriptional regulator [Gemmatimonadota bacterium]NIR81196.1 PadR family transcriptional regulator [Gemmatimonadota bacterium]NIT90041.1 PadR family transcriptional regulator [Gemmatimonadota bacterium]NIU33850.1 PadR family transcriptional regulator [Gemmatimonadota bacterium]NIU38047.1 PadR family transcriptional regulator [Gemmatimonadota bacterium]